MEHDDADFALLDARDIGDMVQGMRPLKSSQIEKIQAWLHPTDYAAISSEYGKHRTSHLAGTGSWIYQTPQYQQWHDSDSGVLWIKAAAGSGKSVLAASLVSRFTEEEQITTVLYFFFRQIVSKNLTPLAMVRDCMSQLLGQSLEIQHSLNSILEERRLLDTMSFEEMWKLLVSSVLSLPRVYLIVDALDEMEAGNESFVKELVSLGQRRPNAIKVVMTSRPVPRLEQILRHDAVTQIYLHSKLVSPDISDYIKYRTAEFILDGTIRSQIHAEMSKRADGFFLYARLMMDELSVVADSSKSAAQDLISALGKLPMPMAGMYSKMLQDHSRRSRISQDLQVALLQWITVAERPLRLLELSSLIDVSSMESLFMENKSIIRHGCGPLLEILEDETVCPIHHSFTEFLYDADRYDDRTCNVEFPILDNKDAHRSIALSCIKLLKTDWYFKWHSTATDQAHDAFKSKSSRFKSEFPFLDYAANNWYVHLRKSDAHDEVVCSKVYDLLAGNSDLLRAWFEVIPPIAPRYGGARTIPETRTPLHIAADKGLFRIAEFLVDRGADIEVKDSVSQTPMSLASISGYTRTVETLLRLGAKNDEADQAGLKPLHHAAMHNHGSTVTALLKSGVDPFTPKTSETPGQWSPYHNSSSIGESAVMYACQRGQVEAIRAFLPYLSIDSTYKALSWAWLRSQAQVVTVLLDATGIDVDHRCDARTLLYLASEAGDTQAIKRLIAMGADAHKSSISCSERFSIPAGIDQQPQELTPLHAFVCGGDMHAYRWNMMELQEGLSTLLDAGIYINSVDSGGWTILHHLMSGTGSHKFSDSRRDELGTVLSMLFERGLSATALTASGATALSLATGISAPIVDLLIKRGVNINQADAHGETPLIAALRCKDLSLAQILLDRGASPTIIDNKGNTPLHLLVREILERDWTKERDGMELAESLVIAGANVNARNRDGNTALHLFTRKATMLNFFMKNGLDLEAKNDAGETVLYLAVGGLEYEAFVVAGADPCTRDSEGRSILHRIVERGTSLPITEALRYFMDKGNSIHALDNFGNSLWHMAARRPGFGNRNIGAILAFLTESGVSPEAPNYAGQTPLHVACCINPRLWSDNQVLYWLLNRNVDLNAMDDDHIRPLHLAVSLSLPITARLLELGADLTASTNEGQTALMTACRARQCDRVCLLLTHYKERQLLSQIDHVDVYGRSALHYACRSGRPESVALLLDLGSSVHVRDKHGFTPLHLCAHYLREKELWDRAQLEKPHMWTESSSLPSYISCKETIRPHTGYDPEVHFRIRESIRLLVANGADTSFLMTPVKGTSQPDPLSMAITEGCDTMVSELLIIRKTLMQPSLKTENNTSKTGHEIGHSERDVPEEHDKHFQSKPTPDIISGQVKDGEYNMDLVGRLLRNEDEPSIELMSRLGARFLPLAGQPDSPIAEMVKLGFTDLVRKFGKNAAQTSFAEMPRNAAETWSWPEDQRLTMLALALDRELPNMEMVKLLVTHFKVDMNKQYNCMNSYARREFHHPIHHLAHAKYWWQTRALEYLLEQGCDIEARNSAGQTALLVALQPGSLSFIGDGIPPRVVRILLEHGADTNVVGSDGHSCLSIVADRPELFRLLLKHGADPLGGRRSLLSTAVEKQNVAVVRLLLEAKIDVNRRPQWESELDRKAGNSRNLIKPDFPSFSTGDHHNRNSHLMDISILSANAYPLHTASCHLFNRPEQYATAVLMTKMLLEAGADPYLMYDDRISILHTLAEQGGIIEPFLKDNLLGLERRDSRGRTVLLAACDCRPDYFGRDRTEAPSLLIQSGVSITAVDDRGRNALHCLIDARPQKAQWSFSTALDSMTDGFLSALVSIPDSQGRTAFHYALSNSHFDLIDSFVANGANPLELDPTDETTILHHLAIGLGNYDDIPLWDPKILTFGDLSCGIDDQSEAPGITARTYLVEKGRFDTASLKERDLGSPGRHFRNFLRLGLSINAQDTTGETPLLKFATEAPRGQIDCGVKSTLLSILAMFENAGADFAQTNTAGESVLHKLAVHATFEGDDMQKDGIKTDLQRAVTWLLKKGVDVSWEDTKSRTCLDVAAASGAQWLLDMYKRE